MAAPVTATEINKYYPTLQPLLNDINDMLPSTNVTRDHHRRALTELSLQQTAENSQYTQEMKQKLENRVGKYVELSHRLNDYNEIYNTNAYIYNELDKSEQKLSKTTQKLKNTIYISKQKTQMYEYEKNKINFYRTLFLISCFLVIDLISLTGLHMQGGISAYFLYIWMGISVIIYLIVMFVLIYSYSYRSRTDWDKYMWDSMSKDKNSKSCR
jgi:hypothetical protein